MSSASSMRMTPKRGYLGVCAVIGLMILTIYMAFAFPFTLFQLKQTETTEIKSVIIIGRGGEKSPTQESYFIGEEPPEALNSIGYEQLTNVGKERMFLLGKFLKLRYYQLLLNGNPRMLQVRAADLDRTIESAQALIAGLNPPKEQWLWSTSKDPLDWQPKAIHTTTSSSDDLLSISPNCYHINQDKSRWKNSTRYQQLLNEFRHDLQTLRANTGLEFEDDLEMLSDIEDSLRNRLAFNSDVPAWYTKTFADRLSHIADVTTESRYNSPDIKRLYVGRLLSEIVNNINGRIRIDQELIAADKEETGDVDGLNNDQGKSTSIDGNSNSNHRQQKQFANFNEEKSNRKQPLGLLSKSKRISDEPKVFIYMTDKQRLSALMNSLQIYTGQPQFGLLLLIELHYDPINKLYYLRLFTISSTSPNVFPEPLRVNPIACADSSECSPQQFEQNIQHLVLDRSSWQDACNTIPQSITPPTANYNNNGETGNGSGSGQQQQQSISLTTQFPSALITNDPPSPTTTQMSNFSSLTNEKLEAGSSSTTTSFINLTTHQPDDIGGAQTQNDNEMNVTLPVDGNSLINEITTTLASEGPAAKATTTPLPPDAGGHSNLVVDNTNNFNLISEQESKQVVKVETPTSISEQPSKLKFNRDPRGEKFTYPYGKNYLHNHNTLEDVLPAN